MLINITSISNSLAGEGPSGSPAVRVASGHWAEWPVLEEAWRGSVAGLTSLLKPRVGVSKIFSNVKFYRLYQR